MRLELNTLPILTTYLPHSLLKCGIVVQTPFALVDNVMHESSRMHYGLAVNSAPYVWSHPFCSMVQKV